MRSGRERLTGWAADRTSGLRGLGADLTDAVVARSWTARYAAAFGAGALAGLRVGLREQSAVGRAERVAHPRTSGNAPEMHVYTEADTPEAASALLRSAIAALDPQG